MSEAKRITLGRDKDGAMLYEGYRIRKTTNFKKDSVVYLVGIHGEPTLRAMIAYIDSVLLRKKRRK